ncbi:MAG TPA: PQQ-dependent sugar dehydrogenase [Actinomycetota bacterium]|nr:PQQ-dependent sugar dehydrogenase [Actinomycetota bacterium]
MLLVIALFALIPLSAGRAQSPSPNSPEDTTCEPQRSITVVAEGNSFDQSCYAAPADTPFEVTLDNKDPFSHNFSIYTEKGGDALFRGEYVTKASSMTYEVPKQREGSYYFVCDIHPQMDGSFLVGSAQAAPSPTQAESRAPRGPAVKLIKVADGLTAPVFMTGARDGSNRFFIVDQTGTITIIDDQGEKLGEPFLNISDKLVKQNEGYDERGLLGLAFHPKYNDNGRFFVWYSAPLRSGAPEGWDHTIHLSEFKVSGSDPDVADAASEKIVMQIDQPQANHNSGHIAFGPDGLLYAPMGDGGAGNDVGLGHPPMGNGQDITTILGNILRIDIDKQSNGKPYAIPSDNPYANGQNGAAPEIFANGFRNPYHISFDAGGDRALYAADAGQDRVEEVSRVVKGGNYGWRIKEGTSCFSADSPSAPPDTCPSTGPRGDRLIDPVIEYNRNEILGSVIIGGYVYRGSAVPALEGRYVFGDYSRDRIKPDGTIFAAEVKSGDGLWDVTEVRVNMDDDPDDGPGFGRFVLAFGQDDRNEVYVSMTGRGGPQGSSGEIFRFAAASSPQEGVGSGSSNNWMWILLGAVVVLGVIAALAMRKTLNSEE